ncbi:V-type proton ATPase subunit D [Blattella germanica]|nr:V-type proton ATPase subunit D [Blattella germanica]
MLGKLKNAQRSHRMLKQKAEGLDMRRRGIAQQIITMKEKVGELMSEAYFSLAEARFICGNFSLFVINTASEACCHLLLMPCDRRLMCIFHFVLHSGAILRSSELVITEELDQFKNIGFSLSSSHLKKVKENFRAVLKLLVQLASLEMSFHNLEVAVKITNSRVNGIEHGE